MQENNNEKIKPNILIETVKLLEDSNFITDFCKTK